MDNSRTFQEFCCIIPYWDGKRSYHHHIANKFLSSAWTTDSGVSISYIMKVSDCSWAGTFKKSYQKPIAHRVLSSASCKNLKPMVSKRPFLLTNPALHIQSSGPWYHVDTNTLKISPIFLSFPNSLANTKQTRTQISRTFTDNTHHRINLSQSPHHQLFNQSASSYEPIKPNIPKKLF